MGAGGRDGRWQGLSATNGDLVDTVAVVEFDAAAIDVIEIAHVTNGDLEVDGVASNVGISSSVVGYCQTGETDVHLGAHVRVGRAQHAAVRGVVAVHEGRNGEEVLRRAHTAACADGADGHRPRRGHGVAVAERDGFKSISSTVEEPPLEDVVRVEVVGVGVHFR